MKIEPYLSVGDIYLGMDSENVHKIMDEIPDSSFNKASMFTEGYKKNSFQVFYKEPGVCEAVEVYAPLSVSLFGKTLINQPFDQIRDWLKEIDACLELEDAGLTSYKYGIALYAPACEENPSCPIEAVLVFEKGYYD